MNEMPVKDDKAAVEASDKALGRRSMLRTLGVAGAVAGVAALEVGRSTNADATTGDYLRIGYSQGAQNMTYLTNQVGSSVISNPLTSEPTLMWGDNRLSSLTNANGIRGDGKGPSGMGIWGNSDSGGVGVHGGGGIGVQAQGSRAALKLIPSGAAAVDRSDYHQTGEFIEDSSGNLWVCVGAGFPGSWRKLAGPASTGAFHVLPAAIRTYDSRSSDGALSGGSRTLTMSGVPNGSSAVTVSLTATGTSGPGYLALYKAGISYPGNSNLNWSASGTTIAVTTVCAVNASSQLVVRGAGGSTQVIIDVIGYYA
ncbi:hypothetical protein ATK17_3721 [Branchiibius hedensis]|uniref:Uncharacterized protein n=1 Tax=Branchiibius hedensis TaxID=672460 RepID=A0A2Y9A1G9_9MICO|nr:hypothetical protein [Branchiibius hedensis]PWJ27519.1 hypothetical protein ATK17_3721 [Branchiibius hedensis]SSA36329.1 hypothetical protein SAMN04489750_3721 [Branchiibius hedensis]